MDFKLFTPGQNILNSAKLYRIPYSSNEKMVDITYHRLLTVLDSNWSYQNMNFADSVANRRYQHSEKQQKLKILLPLSPLLALSRKQGLTFAVIILALLLVYRGHIGYSLILATVIFASLVYLADWNTTNKSLVNLNEECIENGDSIKTLQHLIQSHQTNFFKKAARHSYKDIYQKAQDPLLREELIRAHNLSYLNTYAQASVFSNFSGGFDEKSFYLDKRNISVYIPSEIGFRYFRGFTQMLENAFKRRLYEGVTHVNYLVDIKRFVIQPVSRKRGYSEKMEDYINNEFTKLEKQLSENPHNAFMNGVR